MYFCFYRKCAHLFKKYFLVPLIISLVSTGILTLGFSNFSLTWMAVGFIATLAGYIWYLVNAIRFGKNFNREYYEHIKAILDSGNEKQYGTSLVAALVSVVVYTLVNVLIGTVASLALFSSFGDVDTLDTYEPSTSTFDTSMSSDSDISSIPEDTRNESPNAVFTSGTFATSGNASSVYENGGYLVELNVSGDQVAYTVTSISSGDRIASLSGVALQGNQIHASGDDGCFNVVEGDIIAIDSDTIAIEFEVVSADEYAMWQLSCPYTTLTRCTEAQTTTTTSDYPIQINMDDLMSANILGDTFWSAYAGGWLDEWMFLYVHGASEPDILYEPFWYDEQIGEWTYYGITYSQAAEAGWASIWTEMLETNGYSRY